MPKSPLKLVDEPSDEGVLVEEPAYNEEEANLQQKGWTNKGPDYMADLILVKRIALLQARFKDLPTIDMKEILKQRMFEDNSYKAQDVHNDLYEALQKSLELDYSNQRLADQEQARKKRRKRRASGFSQFPPPPPHPSTGTSRSAQQHDTGVSGAQELSPIDSLMQDDSILDEQFQMEECHKMLTDQVDWTNPKEEQVKVDVNQPLPLGCHTPPRRKHEVKLHGYHYNTMASTI
ncbi:hypothetical protein Tco_1558535, partial [Tanacetum coccineum]